MCAFLVAEGALDPSLDNLHGLFPERERPLRIHRSGIKPAIADWPTGSEPAVPIGTF
jgi:hypothetical protein